MWTCVCALVCQFNLVTGDVREGYAGVYECWDSEMVFDGQGKTRRISLVCLREHSSHVSHTHTSTHTYTPTQREGDGWISCVWHEGSRSGIWLFFVFKHVCVPVCVCACACLYHGHRPWGHLLQSSLVRQAKATLTHCMT